MPKSFHVQLTEGRQEFFNQITTHAHAGKFPSPQILNVFHPGLEVDGALQTTCFSENLLGEGIFRVEARRGRESPAKRRESADHEPTKSRNGRLSWRSAVGSPRGNVGSTPSASHSGEDGEGHFRGRKVFNVLGKVLDGCNHRFKERLIPCRQILALRPSRVKKVKKNNNRQLTLTDDYGTQVIVQDSQQEVEIFTLQLSQLNLVIGTRGRIG